MVKENPDGKSNDSESLYFNNHRNNLNEIKKAFVNQECPKLSLIDSIDREEHAKIKFKKQLPKAFQEFIKKIIPKEHLLNAATIKTLSSNEHSKITNRSYSSEENKFMGKMTLTTKIAKTILKIKIQEN